MYYLANWRKLKSGQEIADLPDGTGYMLLASPCYEPKFSLFECDLEESETFSGVEKISDKMFGIIESAKHFPPALAFGRREIEKRIEEVFKGHASRKEFLKVYQQVLEDLLQKQLDSNYFICKAIDTESGYLYKDEYYWIVNYSKFEKVVSWVSRDYFIYQNPIDYFDVEETFLVNRFNS